MLSHQCSKESKLYLKRETVFSPALQATSRPPWNGIHMLCQRETVNKQSFQSSPPCIYNNKLCSQELILQFIFNTRFILISGIEFFWEMILNFHFLTKWYIREIISSPFKILYIIWLMHYKAKEEGELRTLKFFFGSRDFFFYWEEGKGWADGLGT